MRGDLAPHSGHVSNSPRKPKIASGCAIQDLTTGDDVRHANGRLVIFAVHSQTSAINFGSRERGLDLAGLDLTKYSPETCATSGEVARYRDTAAPCFEFSMNGFTTATISPPMSGSRSGVQIFVATAPGWRQFAVTPVPASLRASSNVNAFISSFDWR